MSAAVVLKSADNSRVSCWAAIVITAKMPDGPLRHQLQGPPAGGSASIESANPLSAGCETVDLKALASRHVACEARLTSLVTEIHRSGGIDRTEESTGSMPPSSAMLQASFRNPGRAEVARKPKVGLENVSGSRASLATAWRSARSAGFLASSVLPNGLELRL